MIYLDYSATTPTNKEVMNSFNASNEKYFGNPNSLHKLGTESSNIINESSNQILNLLRLNNHEIVYTSGSTEANNLAIKGIINAYPNRGKTIITTKLEHSSIIEPLENLEEFNIKYVDLKEGIIDLNNLEELLNDDVILVTINAVDSELGFRQPVEEISKLVKEYPKCTLHIDATQAIGKVNIDYNNVDLISLSAHKFYGIKGIGALIKNKTTLLKPILEGGKSTTIYRSGTPSTSLIVSLAKALRLALEDMEDKYSKVEKLNKMLTDKLTEIKELAINNNNSIPYIINISVPNIKSETILRALENKDIYISTKTACSSNKDISASVMEITNDIEKAKSSLRISLSYLTTEEEINIFLENFKNIINNLK